MLRYKIFILLSVLVFINNILFSQNTNLQSTNQQNTNLQSINADAATGDPDAIFNNGLKELQKGNISEAIGLLEKLLSYNTRNPDYYIYLGYLYYKQGNYDEAVNVLNKSLEYDDMLLVPHILLGEIYYQLNNILEARNQFEEVININSSIKRAHIRLYELYKYNNTAKANEHYLKIFHLPVTKLEKFLPGIEKIGSIPLAFKKDVLILKDAAINKKIRSVKLPDEILKEKDLSVKSNNEQIIISVDNKVKKNNFNLKFLLNPFKNFNKEKFYIKAVEFIFISIFLFICSIFQRRKVKKLERVVLNQYRR